MDPLGVYLSRIFIEFFLKPVYSTMVVEKFQSYTLKIIEMQSQKIESVHFQSCPQAKLSPGFLSLSSRKMEIAHSPLTAFSEDIFPEEKEGRGLSI